HPPPAVDSHGLGVLTPYVDDGPRLGEEMVDALGDARNLGDRLFRERRPLPSAPRCNDVLQVGAALPKLPEHLVNGQVGDLSGIRTRLEYRITYDALLLVEEKGIGRNRADIYPCYHHVLSSFIL